MNSTSSPVAEVIGIDHIYLSVSDLPRSEAFYDLVLQQVLGFRKSAFALGGEPHRQYFNRHYGIVIRQARQLTPHEPYAPGLHHLCLRVNTIDDVVAVANGLISRGVAATPARCCPDYAEDYWATYFTDPDGLRLEVTNYRAERRQRHDHWDELAP
jgi:glyoxylase I family protein